MHSLEHGAIVSGTTACSDDDQQELERKYRNEAKVLVVPYPDCRAARQGRSDAWGRMVECEELSTEVIDGFIDRFRDARTAPEPRNGI